MLFTVPFDFVLRAQQKKKKKKFPDAYVFLFIYRMALYISSTLGQKLFILGNLEVEAVCGD